MSLHNRRLSPASLLNNLRRSSGNAAFEPLESRELLAAVSWDGGAFTPNWHDPLNWSNDAIPTVADDVTIPATSLASINYTAATGARSVNSLNSAENLSFSGGTLTVATTASTTAQVTLSGGTLSGGAWSPLSLFANSGTMNNVALSGDLNVGTFGSVDVTGTTTFAVAHLPDGADIRFSPGYVLNSTVRAEGTGGNARTISTTAAGTLTIGPSGMIELAAGAAGSLSVGAASVTLVNNGTIANNATSRTLTIGAGSTTSNGTISATAGTLTINTAWTNPGAISASNATLNFNGAWSSTGTISINSTTLNLGGTFTTAGMDLADFTRTGGTVNLTGTLTNSGLTLNAATGSWNLSTGGTITGGTLAYAAGAQLLVTNGTLNNVAVAGELFFNPFGNLNVTGTTTFNVARLPEGADIRFSPDYVLNSTVRAEGTGGNTRTITTTTTGTLTIGPAGLVELAAGTAGPFNVGSSSTTLINNGTIVNNATSRTLTIGAGSTTNNGTISATAGTLTINNAWTNAGAISASNATLNFNGAWSSTGTISINSTTLNLGGTFTTAGMDLPDFSRVGGTVNLNGTLTNSVLTLNSATGSWNLTTGGVVSGGTLGYADGAQLLATNGTLNNVAVAGDLFFNPFGNLNVTGTTTFTVAHLPEGADIRFSPGYVLNSTVRAEGPGGNTRTVATTTTGTLTIGPTGLVELAAGTAGPFNVGANTTNLVNNGTIVNNATSRTLTIGAGSMTNGGTISASAGTLTINNAWTNAGAISASNATLNFAGNWSTSGTVSINNTTLNLGGAFTTAGMDLPDFTRVGGTVNLNGTLTNSALTLDSATGSWNLTVGGTVSGGTLAYADGSQLRATNGVLENVAVSGDLFFNTFGLLHVTGSTTFNVAHLPEGADIRFAPGYVLSSTVRAEGTGGNTRTVATTTTGLLTIGPSGLVELAAGTAGPFNVGASTTTLINNGTIINNATSRTLTVNAGSTTNNGTISATAGTLVVNGTWSNTGSMSATNATMTFGGTWSSAGAISINASTLNLGGAFSSAGFSLANFTRVGGTVNLTGTLTNTGLTLNAATGSWVLSTGGTINGGSVSFLADATLVSSSGELNNVTVNGDLHFAPFGVLVVNGSTTFSVAHLINGADIRFAPGYVLNSTVRAEGTGGSSRAVRLTSAGTLTIGIFGVVEIAPDSAGGLDLGSTNNTVINNGTVASYAPGRTLLVTATTLANHSGTTLTGGAWRAVGGTINLGTGRTVSTNAATIELDGATSSFPSFSAFASNPGTLTLRGGRDLAVGSFTNSGTLVLNSGSQLTVTGDFTQSSTGSLQLFVRGDAGDAHGRVIASNLVTLGGSWSVGAQDLFIPAYGTIFDLVIGGSRSGLFSGFTSGSVPGGRFLELYSASAARVTFERATGLWTGLGDGINWTDPLNWFNNTIPGPTDDAFISLPASDPSILVNSGTQSVGSVFSNESITILPSATLTLGTDLPSRFEAPLNNNGTLSVLNEAAAFGGGTHAGNFTLSPGAVFQISGDHTFAAASSIAGAGSVYVFADGATFDGSIAAATTLAVLDGAIATLNNDYSLLSIINSGTLAIGAHSISLTGGFTQAATGVLDVDLIDASTVGNITTPITVAFGSVVIASSTGFDPSSPMIPLFGIDVINSGNAFGNLAVASNPTMAVGSFVARFGPTGARLLHNAADFNGDGSTDGDDVIAFFDAWDNGFSTGDITGDGSVDGDDVILFFGLWDNGGV